MKNTDDRRREKRAEKRKKQGLDLARDPLLPLVLHFALPIYQQAPLIEFDKLVRTLLEWGDEIFAFHDTGDRATNGRIEGTNGKLSVLKRVAYGFVNISNFAARAILLTPGMATAP